jgi:hypothetical protein
LRADGQCRAAEKTDDGNGLSQERHSNPPDILIAKRE